MGWIVPNPTCRHVCSGETGHAEVIQITFDHNPLQPYCRLVSEPKISTLWNDFAGKLANPTPSELDA